jgi:hypothetical protein
MMIEHLLGDLGRVPFTEEQRLGDGDAADGEAMAAANEPAVFAPHLDGMCVARLCSSA